MLTGEIKPTSGIAFVAGENVINNMEAARRNMGYCP
jgi:ATP-binding cassette subfamily A (ABC1) protein 3